MQTGDVLQKKKKKKKKTSDAGSQYRCGRVGRGIKPPALPKPHPQPPSDTLTHKKYQLQHPNYMFFRVFNSSVAIRM